MGGGPSSQGKGRVRVERREREGGEGEGERGGRRVKQRVKMSQIWEAER